eukprot:CAMPEP_0201575850 /NCGR_PEP_ID=MMETSP0190_2-20130828/21273_1 /ASSEMBLY_ACC=CAM_ASM_000263 /TAXON_ID=37353 /ORGANISM="Rosalina sp." /LENGTH=210 /DNA_ID=CAMNT_0048005985 /DNA_START=408 /DNA_END=1037 /DNA_ORIENTATION=+
MTISASSSLGTDIEIVTVSTEATDAICLNAASVTTIDLKTYNVMRYPDGNKWISNDCDSTPTLTPCSSSTTFTLALYYFVTDSKDDWDTTREDCESEGGDLAMFITQAEILAIFRLCENAVLIRDSPESISGYFCFVGFEEFGSAGYWQWVNGNEFDGYDFVYNEDGLEASSWNRAGCVDLSHSMYTPIDQCDDRGVNLLGSYGICQVNA